MKNEKGCLRHITDGIKHTEPYTTGVSEREFFGRRMVQDAVIRQLKTIGNYPAGFGRGTITFRGTR